MTLPNFLLAGAPKAGTTSLALYLEQHPEIFLAPVKEPSYFALELRPESFVPELRGEIERERVTMRAWLDGPMTEKRLGGMVETWEDYCSLFRGVRGEKAIGEASVIYLWSPSAPSNIAAKLGQPKLVLVLRDPAERAFSQYLNMVSAGRIKSSMRALLQEAIAGPKLLGFHRPFLELGMYYEQVTRYLKFFPRETMSIHLYEDFLAQPLRVIAEIFRFLEVDAKFQPDMSERARTPQVPKEIRSAHVLKKLGLWQAARRAAPERLLPAIRRAVFRPRKELKLEPEDRQWLVEYYREDVGRLAELLRRDLSAWLR